MGKTLYLDCQSGISGDMFVAALLDLGANEQRLRDALASLPVDGYGVRVSRVKKAGIDCCDFDVVLDAGYENHDHDMGYLHGHDHHHHGDHDHGHDHGDDHGHDRHHHGHDHDHDHGHGDGHGHPHDHHHRSPLDIDRIIDAGQLAPRAHGLAHRMVDIIARAEAQAHAVPLDQVHFHEVGAVDSIVDIVSAAVLIDDLDVDRVIVPVLAEGSGTIRCQHGVIPVPVPATLNIAIAHDLPLAPSGVEGELVTPTGAAIVAALDPVFELPERYRVKRAGMGAGKRAYERPSVLRAMIIEVDPPAPVRTEDPASFPALGEPTVDEAYAGPVVRLECDIDDATGEVLAYAADRLREAGAREVHWVPVFCKKGRPAWQLQVIALPGDVDRLESVIFSETTTIGIRRWTCERTVLERAEDEAQTPWGPVRTKTVTLPDGSTRTSAEFEDAARAARRAQVPLRDVIAHVSEHGGRSGRDS